MVSRVANQGVLAEDVIAQMLHQGLQNQFANKKVLVLIPDHTRSLPLPFLFRALVEVLADTSQLDFMVALGTHPPLTNEQLFKLVGIRSEEKDKHFKHVGHTRG